jgi:hypothetical protein
VTVRASLAAVFASLILLAPPSAFARDSVAGTIYVTTLPTGADTWVDGQYIGRTPLLIDALGSGPHTVTTAKTGWLSHEVKVTITEQRPFQFVDFQLDRDTNAPPVNGMLSLHADAPIKTVNVDGLPVKLVAGRSIDLPPGEHDVLIETAHDRYKRHVEIYPDTTTNVVLRPGAGGGGRAIVVAPASNYLAPSDITVEGKRIEIRHNGHNAAGTLGDPTMRIDGDAFTFDTAPTMIGGKLFLPLDLYVRLGAVPLRTR